MNDKDLVKWFADWFNKVNNSDRVNKIKRILDAIK